MKLAIIGTAGRGDDAHLLTEAHWRMMLCVGQAVAATLDADWLVSGGSSWADQVAVQLFLDGHVKHLNLCLPAPLIPWIDGCHFDKSYEAGRRLNELHDAFSDVVDYNTIERIVSAQKAGAVVNVNLGGFKARNTDVANLASSLLAFTFSDNGLPADGGTADTWRKFEASVHTMFVKAHEQYQESPCGCSCNIPDPSVAFHFDLLNHRLTRHTISDPVMAAERAAIAEEREKREAAAPVAAPRHRTPHEIRHRLL